jgi:hypothetical protein
MTTRKILDQNKANLPHPKQALDLHKKQRPSTKQVGDPRLTKAPLKIITMDTKPSNGTYQERVLTSNKSTYQGDHLKCLIDIINSAEPNRECLAHHTVSVDMRSKMLNWLMEVLAAYECADSTFFLAATLMDTYYKKETRPQTNEDVFLTGVTCTFIASKFEDRCPLSMQLVIESVAHNELTISEVKGKEKRIMELLEYKMPELTPIVVLEFINASFLKACSLSAQAAESIYQLSLFCAKMFYFNYDLQCYNYGVVALGSLLVAVKKIGYDNGLVSNWVLC